MADTAAPFGFRPVRTESGRPVQHEIIKGGLASGYGTTIYCNQPIEMGTAGLIVPATAGNRILGVFAGCEYTDAQGRQVVSAHWPASTTTKANTDIYCYVYTDQSIIYECECDGSLAQTAIDDQADHSNATNGSTDTGLSSCTLSSTLVGAGNNAGFRIVGLSNDVNEDWGNTYTRVYVRISEHTYTADRAAI